MTGSKPANGLETATSCSWSFTLISVIAKFGRSFLLGIDPLLV